MGGNGTVCPMKLLMCIRGLVALLAVGAMTACASVPKRNPVPEEWAETATIPGIPYARFWGEGRPLTTTNALKLFGLGRRRTTLKRCVKPSLF